MAFEARFAGDCAACGEDVKGEQCTYVDDEMVHLACAYEAPNDPEEDLSTWKPQSRKTAHKKQRLPPAPTWPDGSRRLSNDELQEKINSLRGGSFVSNDLLAQARSAIEGYSAEVSRLNGVIQEMTQFRLITEEAFQAQRGALEAAQDRVLFLERELTSKDGRARESTEGRAALLRGIYGRGGPNKS